MLKTPKSNAGILAMLKKTSVLLVTALVLISFSMETVKAWDATAPRPAAPEWEQVCDDATATVYHAVPAQCNDDVAHTASMFEIDTAIAGSYRILAMERTMMAEYGIVYGDVVRVEGAGAMDGLWRVEDTMNRRYANCHKIDFLVDRRVTAGKWDNVHVYRKANARPYQARRTTI